MHRPSRKYLQMYLPLCSTVCWLMNSLLIMGRFFWKLDIFPSCDTKSTTEWAIFQFIHVQDKLEMKEEALHHTYNSATHLPIPRLPCPGLLLDLVHVLPTVCPLASFPCWASRAPFLVRCLCPFPFVQLKMTFWEKVTEVRSFRCISFHVKYMLTPHIIYGTNTYIHNK